MESRSVFGVERKGMVCSCADMLDGTCHANAERSFEFHFIASFCFMASFANRWGNGVQSC